MVYRFGRGSVVSCDLVGYGCGGFCVLRVVCDFWFVIGLGGFWSSSFWCVFVCWFGWLAISLWFRLVCLGVLDGWIVWRFGFLLLGCVMSFLAFWVVVWWYFACGGSDLRFGGCDARFVSRVGGFGWLGWVGLWFDLLLRLVLWCA